MTASRRNGDSGMTTAAARAGSLGRRLVLATLAFGIVFTVAAVGLRTCFAWRDNVTAMTAELTLIDQVFERALSKAIWDMDRDELRRHVATVSQVASVGRIELRIPRAGRAPEIIAYRKPGVSPAHAGPSLHRMLTFESYPGATETVGEFTLEGDERVLWAQLRGELVDIIVTQVIQSVLLAGLVMWLFNRTVTVHVQRIAHHLEGITPANLGQTLRLDRSTSRLDELSLLESGVNELQGNLAEYLSGQREAERDLAAHRDRLTELVGEQTAELRGANARLEELSRSDPLTGLANRRHFDEVKDAEFRRAERLGQPLSVLLCDVDYFKRYNDTYGHALGDRCLKAIADTMKETFARAGELPARIGGEEFAVLLPAVDAAHARLAAERLREALERRGIAHSGSDVGPHVTLSIGVAQLDIAAMDSFDALFARADEALYRAKNLGRDQVAV
jgi:diguanylate cyclase (GGDEF)-like protein